MTSVFRATQLMKPLPFVTSLWLCLVSVHPLSREHTMKDVSRH